jgi:Na+-transporting NADH:ubiquinone oxidoreductase subunit NqrF
MPKLTVEGAGTFEVAEGTRLVEFVEGEPSAMTEAERDKLAQKGLSGVRLSCQIACTADMTVRANSRLAGSGRADAGSRPAPHIEPPPVWVSR